VKIYTKNSSQKRYSGFGDLFDKESEELMCKLGDLFYKESGKCGICGRPYHDTGGWPTHVFQAESYGLAYEMYHEYHNTDGKTQSTATEVRKKTAPPTKRPRKKSIK